MKTSWQRFFFIVPCHSICRLVKLANTLLSHILHSYQSSHQNSMLPKTFLTVQRGSQTNQRSRTRSGRFSASSSHSEQTPKLKPCLKKDKSHNARS
ncbi:hypothetical protein VNO80_29550 [Phaseolus coccineus]|uniref:Uncharacterized protein n=1 Tax=Phaseolus coccineus TaxID=3886 RepID=A0AAN9QCJ2_PHACN